MRLKTLAHCNIKKMFDGVDVIKLNPTFNCDMFCGVVTKFIAHIMFTIDVLLLARKLNNDCGLVHRNLCQSSIFVDAAGNGNWVVWNLCGNYQKILYLHQR